MPRRHRTGAHAERGPNGAFTTAQAPSVNFELIDDQDDEDSGEGWEFSTDDGLDESELEEYWGQLPPPMTWEERMKKRAIQKEIAEKKHRIAEMRSAEYNLDGPMPKQKGALHIFGFFLHHNETVLGKKNGPKSIGGMAERTAQVKRKALREDFEKGRLAISKEEFERQMGHLQACYDHALSDPFQSFPANPFTAFTAVPPQPSSRCVRLVPLMHNLWGFRNEGLLSVPQINI
ncbi:hypothetical protein DFH08DRAFT_817469 [Mycena albidolilacea]|uniref:Uncharacterized protein n=1 Tax=Mycena albidolilacea TaxID=1033008 RepID=A0AAD7EIP8_9AGAR|nr:hypothetical protein DFH08DRAFT_817469 [Mycena albidolilacea]